MKFITTRVHAVLDYVVGVILIAAPWLLGFNDGTAAQWVPVILGAITIIMSLMTAYEGGIVKTIPMSAHLTMDILSGVVLAASPWLFGFADRIYWPHLLFGLLEILVASCTRSTVSEVHRHGVKHSA